MNNQSQHYSREQKAIKLESVCGSQCGIMLLLHLLLDNPTLRFTETVYNDRKKY